MIDYYDLPNPIAAGMFVGLLVVALVFAAVRILGRGNE